MRFRTYCPPPPGNLSTFFYLYQSDMDMKNVPDLTSPNVQSKATDGQWFEIIQKGKGEMPPEASRAKSDDDLWNLVNYCRAFGKK